MRIVRLQLVHTRFVTYVHIVAEEAEVVVDTSPRIMLQWHRGEQFCVYTNRQTGDVLGRGHHFDVASPFQHGYGLVQHKKWYFHINERGKIAYQWRFSDVGPMNESGHVLVQHPRAFGWSLFHVPTGKFTTNPPRYRR